MNKCIAVLSFFIINSLMAQDPTRIGPNTEKDTSTLSSLETNVGITNSAFSQHSRALGADASAQKLFLVPAIVYSHKSGFSIMANAYLDFGSGTKNPFQYSIRPGYDYAKSNALAVGVSYNYYFGRDATSRYSSPYQHEIYAYYTNKQGWLNWGLSIDFSTGNSSQTYSKDSLVTNAAGTRKTVTLSATANSKTTDLIFSPTISHEFIVDGSFTGSNDLTIKPAFILNAGYGKYSAKYTGNVGSFALAQLKTKKRNTAGSGGTDNTPFGIQSAAVATTVSYQVGNLSVVPELYIEYFLPRAESRFSYIYTVTIGYSF